MMSNRYFEAYRANKGRLAYAAGVTAEMIAEAALISAGSEILLRRARTSRGEIDLIAQHKTQLCFIEVKHRPTWTEAAESLTRRQQYRIIQAAEIILAGHPEWTYESISFDMIAVNESGEARRIKNAFWLD
ncbi:YraN family protein [Acetobacter fallax]|uniref:UPF0102 protein GOB84_06955 n=1 Tax=Acetobacter fallax TaxID=1737473 RepID=A0ABX0K7D6_9PROT|nr:YraN family protein [Acetobacter fallax]NHO32304.1 YraN family protein [Acetobacter fallax]NHO35864.1 YraN family protein [Acetobacter fallax]